LKINPINILLLRQELTNTPIDPQWETNGFVRSDDDDIEEFANWCAFVGLRQNAPAADDAKTANGIWLSQQQRMVRPWKGREKAISFKFIDPTYTNRAGYKFTKWFEDDFDFEPTAYWIRIHNPTYVVYDDISGHFHAGWILNEWTPVETVQELRHSMKSSTGGDRSKNNWLVTSPAYNPKGRKYCEHFTKDGTLRRQCLLTKGADGNSYS
jgi:hypothetical protein